MSEYYMFECYMPIDWDDMALLESQYFGEIDTWRNDIDGWRYGRPIINIPDPLILKIRQGYPNNLKEMYNSGALVMTRRLITTLQEAGVNNMDIYPCTIINEGTGFSTEDYAAVNLLGLVKAVDMENTTVASDKNNTGDDFEGLKIDELKAKNHLLFRLEENSIAIVIHRSVKEYLEEKGFSMLTFQEPKEWIG